MDDYDIIYNGPSAATLILAGLLFFLMIGWFIWWIGQQPPPAPAPAPPPPAPPSPSPKAPAPPSGVSEKVSQKLVLLKSQTAYLHNSAQESASASSRYWDGEARPLKTPGLDPFMDPIIRDINELVKRYEVEIEQYAEKCRKMIEK